MYVVSYQIRAIMQNKQNNSTMLVKYKNQIKEMTTTECQHYRIV